MCTRAFWTAWQSVVNPVAARGRRAARIVACASAVLVLAAPGARAGMVDVSFRGLVTDGSPNWNQGDPSGPYIYMYASYDDSEYDGVGLGVITFAATNSNNLYVSWRDFTYEVSDSSRYDSGPPLTITLLDGLLVDTDFSMPGAGGGISSQGLVFDAVFYRDGEPIFIYGTWNAVVPEPSSVVLLGVAAVGLAGWMRRRSPDAPGRAPAA